MKAIATRSGDWWAVEVPEVPGARTQSRTAAGVAAMAQEVVALLLDVDQSTVEIDVEFTLPDDLGSQIAQAHVLQEEAARLRDAAAAASRTTARALVAAGLSQKDAAEVLGVSFQRVHQLVSEEPRADTHVWTLVKISCSALLDVVATREPALDKLLPDISTALRDSQAPRAEERVGTKRRRARA